MIRALSLPGCACRGAFQFAVMARLAAAGERFDLMAGASSGSVCGAVAVAGLAAEGPAMWRAMARTPVTSLRYLARERSIFGMSAILREALQRFVPEERLHGTETELLVATTRALPFALGALQSRGAAAGAPGLVVHSNRERRDMHDVIVASCYIPVVYARPTWLDGELHVDGGAADNTLVSALVARGAEEITLVTPYAEGVVARTIFAPERPPEAPPHVRLRIIYPERPLRQRRFDFSPGPLEEALSMPHRIRVVEPQPREAPDRSASPTGADRRT
jgi:NTE family protein